MKTKFTLFSMVLTLALSPPMFGQAPQTDTTSTNLKTHDILSMKGMPRTDTISTDLKTHEISNMKGMPVNDATKTDLKTRDMSGMMGKLTSDSTKADLKTHDMSVKMGKPTADATVGGLHIKVWLMTQTEHKEMMAGMKHEGAGMSGAMRDSMMAGTHHIMLDVTDVSLGKEIANASAKVLVVSPTKKSSSVDLKSRMSHFGGALTLDEKGEYGFTVVVTDGGVSKTTKFQYAVK
jgi:hypothetical protein